ncbi:MAG: OmpA family protein [Bacteroidia bacterium]|nr:OmpA family protein [Bacteroidia bacterium]
MRNRISATLVLIFCMACLSGNMYAQGDIMQFDPDKKDRIEVGINLGAAWAHGDLTNNDNGPKIGLGVGLHLRKAFDHIFSARVDLNYASYKSEIGASNETKTTWLGGDVMGVVSLNNFKIDKGEKKSNVYIGAGAGIDGFKAEPDATGNFDGRRVEDIESKLGVHGAFVAGIAFKVGKNMSFGVEHKLITPVGQRADYLDGVKFFASGGSSPANDVMHFTNVNLNFHLGKDDMVDPLYWVSPLTYIYKDVAEVKARPKLDLTDTDGDGVIDMLDQEKDSPSGAPVDTRGIALDSDGDGLADHEDKEPYSPPGYEIDREGVAQVPPPARMTEDDVIRIGQERGWDAAAKNASSIADWFLPIIHFDFDRYNIKDTEVGKLYQVATVMQKNPSIRVVAHGHTDKVASNRYNNVLSYNRAKAAIDYITMKYGIDRSRFVLNWGGEDSALIEASGRNLINRRVEFRVAGSETEMGRPEGPEAGRGSSFSGNRDAGY